MNEYDKHIWITVLFYFFMIMGWVLLGGNLVAVPIFAAGGITSVVMQVRKKNRAATDVPRCGGCRRRVSSDTPVYGTFGYCCSSRACQNVMILEYEAGLRG